MPQRAAMNKYKQNAVQTATPEELTMMLYNGAIKFMKIGQHGIEENDISKRNEALIRAQQIVTELQASLNMDYEISEDMDRLYDFVMSKLIDGNINKSTKDVDEALEIITEMKDAWQEVIKQTRQQKYEAK